MSQVIANYRAFGVAPNIATSASARCLPDSQQLRSFFPRGSPYSSLLFITLSLTDRFLIALCSQRKEYVKYAKVFPLSGTLDFKVPSKWYRRVVGSLEIICGLAMAIIPSRKETFLTPFLFSIFRLVHLDAYLLLLENGFSSSRTAIISWKCIFPFTFFLPFQTE